MDRQGADDTLQQAQKMATLGRLTGGVAHDFNNLLTVIWGHSAMIMEQLSADDPLREHAEMIIDAAGRAAALTHQLLAFSRHTAFKPTVLNLNDVVREAERMLQRLIGEDVLFTTVLDPSIHSVKIDSALFGQVLMNLAVNARDAMSMGGTLTIETCNVNWEPNHTFSRLHVAKGRYVMLAATDTGCGMTTEAMARAFEPFFTTKEVGKGTGLGLAVVQRIIKQSDGYIEAYSEPDVGTTFKIYLPAVDEQVTALRAVDSCKTTGGVETILLVEDEKDVRDLALHALCSHGYEVLAAADGVDALQVVNEVCLQRPIDLLVTDVVMPRMGGGKLADALHAIFPKMKVLYTSGFTDDALIRNGILRKEVSFLQKPYTPRSLTRKVRAVMDEIDCESRE